MIKDYQLEFSRLQTITASAASTNYINQGAAGDAYGGELYLVCRVGTAFATGTSLTISLQTDTDSGFATNLETLATSGAILTASLTANTEVFKIRLPQGLKQYFRLYYTVAGSNFTTGTIDAFLTKDIKQEIV